MLPCHSFLISFKLSSLCISDDSHQIDEGKNEDPDEVQEVPKEAEDDKPSKRIDGDSLANALGPS